MTHDFYQQTDEWFAWYPVQCECGEWVWWKNVLRTIDERPLIYLGLVPTIKYHKI